MFQRAMFEERKPCLHEKAYAVMLRYGITEILETARRQLMRAQEDDLTRKWKRKKIHDVFVGQVEVEGYDVVSTHRWLQAAHLRAETEAMIVTAQDGVIHIAAYRQSTQRKKGSPMQVLLG